MVNFRFHLVSLTAVFLALAAGILVGAGVVDQKTVDGLRSRIEVVSRHADRVEAHNHELEADQRTWQAFAAAFGDQAVAGRLVGSRVLVVAVQGVDKSSVDDFRASASAAGATVEGTIWFTSKWRLSGDKDMQALSELVGNPTESKADAVRLAGVTAVANSLATGQGTAILDSLVQDGFLTYDADPASALPITSLAQPGTAFVVAAGTKAAAPNDTVALPLAKGLADAGRSVLAVEPAKPAKPGKDDQPSFVAALRKDGNTDRLSTVDNFDDYRGRVAAVLALRQLAEGRTGHYGTSGADKLLPEVTP